MVTFIKNKQNKVWIWTAIVKFDGETVPYFYVGDRSESTFWKFFEILPLAEEYYSDAYSVYQKVSENIRNFTVKKGKYKEINRNETLHSCLRQYCAFLRRKSRSFAKSLKSLLEELAMIVYLRFYDCML